MSMNEFITKFTAIVRNTNKGFSLSMIFRLKIQFFRKDLEIVALLTNAKLKKKNIFIQKI